MILKTRKYENMFNFKRHFDIDDYIMLILNNVHYFEMIKKLVI